jgi:hypothetical protein
MNKSVKVYGDWAEQFTKLKIHHAGWSCFPVAPVSFMLLAAACGSIVPLPLQTLGADVIAPDLISTRAAY